MPDGLIFVVVYRHPEQPFQVATSGGHPIVFASVDRAVALAEDLRRRGCIATAFPVTPEQLADLDEDDDG
jgi:hypothetical protein